VLSRHVGRAASSGVLSHLIGRRYSAHLSRYGVIRFDRSPSLTDKNHDPGVDQPALWQDSPLARVAPVASAILSDSVCCRKMLFVFEPFICLCPSMDGDSALRSELCSWLFCCPYRCQLSSEARFFPYRRLPTALSSPGNRQCSLPEGGVRRYKPILQIALPRFCPEPLRVKVPNRGVDWSSRPRRACYPWGNFSVTSSPQQ
jgi:hypothetical protein